MKNFYVDNYHKITFPSKNHLKIHGKEDTIVKDEYHSIHELYQHRMALTIALTKFIARLHDKPPGSSQWCFRSKLHHDETMFEGGYFIVGICWQKNMEISYHYKLKHWDKFDHCVTLDKALEYDGHTSQDVIERLIKL